MKIYQRSLFVFRRDLRLEDNTALLQALRSSSFVLPCFILDPRQVNPHPYRSDFALRFLAECLVDLKDQLQAQGARLYMFRGRAEDVIETLISKHQIQAVFVNEDYTPFSTSRDLAIKKNCAKHQVVFHSYGDLLLHEPKDVFKQSGGPYTVFTPFFRRCQTLKLRPVEDNLESNYLKTKIEGIPEGEPKDLITKGLAPISIKGGRAQALLILDTITAYKDYVAKRDVPALDATTHLSAHHKFGTLSIREVYRAIVQTLGKGHMLINEIYWREFFTHIAHHFPHVFGHAFYGEYDSLKWSHNKEHFQRWCDGETGFPIVDAGMRELNTTGFMHNRVRMITACFLVKDLHIDWQWGERYFASRLVDYDPAVNNGNWQWAASTGCDHQPYFRIFNPTLQQQRFDPNFTYIRRWIKEFGTPQYPKPMVDHKNQSIQTIAMYKAIKGYSQD